MDVLTLGAARVFAGLLAGLYVAFLVAVMPALHGLDDATFTRVMVRINEAIVNPAFVALFLGAPLLTGLVLVREAAPVTVVATVLGVAGLVITFAANIPLNNALDAGGTRQAFETPWLTWHAVRTVAVSASFVALLRV